MLLTITLGVISTVASVVSIYLFAEELRNRRQFGWKHVDKLVRKIILSIQRDDFKPDLVIGLGRGGAILAGILAGNMNHLPLVVLDTILEKEGGMSTVRVRFPQSCPPLRDLNVLLVVGELYSGEDLKKGIDFVRRRHPKSIRTASLLSHPAASIQPNFLGLESDRPLSAPWRISDHYRTQRL